jgi:hypothetical protein
MTGSGAAPHTAGVSPRAGRTPGPGAAAGDAAGHRSSSAHAHAPRGADRRPGTVEGYRTHGGTSATGPALR